MPERAKDTLEYWMGSIDTRLARIETVLKEQKKVCDRTSGNLANRVDGLERFNDRLTARVGLVGAIAGALVVIADVIWKPVWKWISGH